ncbi:hypothetical protein Lste_1009 [Legionella steelei]|uniref:Uncharacterized protein n=1 Tax=Legionella steelei TaxID=947033 RepID=A0A0W0ZFF8_9GAMM|nr:hypothetical protein [Legionella steelei]KTD67851.1 hypothetical protein Lste_1009 [Legionella steelei]
MTAKFFSLLPTAYHRYVDTFLNSNESSRLATTSQYFHASSKLPPTLPAKRQSLKKFLSHVVHGEHKQVQEILRHDIRLLLQRDTVTDCSGREFASISGFEYALWALDKHLWDDMLACLPVDEQDHLTEEDRGIVAELQRQYVQVKTQGVTYKLNGVSKTERHYDFAFINALQEQVKAQKAPGAKNWNDIDEHWRTVVGGGSGCVLCMW